MPFNQVIILLLALYGLTRKPTFDVSHFSGLRAIMFIAMGYLAIVSFYGVHSEDASDWTRRLLVCSGNGIDLDYCRWASAYSLYCSGILSGDSFNAVGYFAGFAPATGYVGYLTGWLGDKNVLGSGVLSVWSVDSELCP